MAEENVSISISDAYQEKFPDVVRRLKRAGLTVDQELPGLGLVTGSIDAEKVSKVRRVRGVAALERQRGVQIPPPESDVQ